MSAFRKSPPAAAEPWSETGRPDAGPSIAEQFGLLPDKPRVAVLIPCRNEEASIGKVVCDFLQAVPEANVYVYDNNSTDRTAQAAQAAGAFVRREWLQGKGHVVRRMFADIEADVYVLVDGDDTYDAGAAPGMLRMLTERHLDMVTATRHGGGPDAYRPGHRFGNLLMTFLVTRAFGTGISDLLSGYRVFSRRFVKSFPALSSGFETETEFSVHALALHMPVQEVRTAYRNRAAGTRSKLNTIGDGLRILRAITTLIRQERPLEVFSIAALIFAGLGIGLGIPVVMEFVHTGLVTRLPSALLSMGLVLMAFLAVTCGLILDAVSRGRREIRRLAYLAITPGEWLE
nr:glycosyltransferase family 2 protein [uncultured Rhodopila sp.]